MKMPKFSDDETWGEAFRAVLDEFREKVLYPLVCALPIMAVLYPVVWLWLFVAATI